MFQWKSLALLFKSKMKFLNPIIDLFQNSIYSLKWLIFPNKVSFKRSLIAFFLVCPTLLATPTSLFWTPCTTEVVPVGVGTFGIDSYFKPFPEDFRGQILTPDIGLEIGVLNWYDLKMEVGLDYLPSFPSNLVANNLDCPVLFNAKIAVDECVLFRNAPSMSVGIFNVGVTTFSALNVFDVILGKKIPCYFGGGNLYLGAYKQCKTFGKHRQGLMIGYQKRFCKTTYCDDEEYYRWIFVADYATGKNEVGAGGFGLYYFFNPYTSLATGPTFFNSAKLYGSWKWAIFLTVSFPVVKCTNPYQQKKAKKTAGKIKDAKQESINSSGQATNGSVNQEAAKDALQQ